MAARTGSKEAQVCLIRKQEHVRRTKTRTSEDEARLARCSVLTRQVDYVVGKVQRDLIQRKIGVLDLLGEYDIAVAIVASGGEGRTWTDASLFGRNDVQFQSPEETAAVH